MRFTTDDKQLIKWMSKKNYIEKSLLKTFLMEFEALMG